MNPKHQHYPRFFTKDQSGSVTGICCCYSVSVTVSVFAFELVVNISEWSQHNQSQTHTHVSCHTHYTINNFNQIYNLGNDQLPNYSCTKYYVLVVVLCLKRCYSISTFKIMSDWMKHTVHRTAGVECCTPRGSRALNASVKAERAKKAGRGCMQILN